MAFNLLKMLGLEAKRPDMPEPKKMEEYLSPETVELENSLIGFGKSRMSPDYQAITPGQQSMMFNRIREQLQPTFDEQFKSQEQSIFNQGITGTPGTAILNKLRQDYMKDLSGRATDIAIQNIGLTESGRQYGTGLTERMYGALTGRAAQNQGIDANYRNQVLQSEIDAKNQNAATAQALGTLVGQIGETAMKAYAPTSGGNMTFQSLADMFGGKKKTGNAADWTNYAYDVLPNYASMLA